MRKTMAAGLGTLAAADLILFALRLRSLLQDGTLAVTTGLEEPVVRHVWLARQGLPVYGPADGAGSLPLYNWLFYASFGHVAGLFEEGPASILRFGRLFNGLLVAAGAAVHFLLARFVLARAGLRLPAALIAAAVLPAWIGSGLIRWFALTVRPDGAAVLFATLGLLLYARGAFRAERSSLPAVVAAAVAFWAAWSFKQSVVLLLGGCLLDAALSRRPARFAALAAPFAGLVGATVFARGGDYAALLLSGPAASPFTAEQAAHVLPRALIPPAFYWIAPAAWLAAQARSGFAGLSPPTAWLARCAAVSFAGACVLSLRQGAYVYYFWEAIVAGGTLACVALADPPGARGLRAATAAALAVTLGASAAQLAAPGKTSRVDLLTAERAATVRERIDAVRSLPAPRFCEDRLLALPWYGGGGDPRAPVLDPNLEKSPRITRLTGEGVGGRIRRGDFACVVLDSRDRFGFVGDAEAAGLRRIEMPALDRAGLVVMVAPGS
jgi:hypothetical protein